MIISTHLLRNYKMVQIEIWHASAVCFMNDAQLPTLNYQTPTLFTLALRASRASLGASNVPPSQSLFSVA